MPLTAASLLWDPCQTAGARPPQQPQQHRLHLIIDVMGRKQHFIRLQHLLESVVAFAASVSLKPATG